MADELPEELFVFPVEMLGWNWSVVRESILHSMRKSLLKLLLRFLLLLRLLLYEAARTKFWLLLFV